MLGIEGGHAIEDSLGALCAYYDLGVRYMTLTHNRHTPDDVIAMLPKNGGVLMVTFVSGFISQEAVDVLLPMIQEYLARAEGKSEAERNALNKELQAKYVMPTVTIAAVADHIDYIRKVAGMDHIGIGGDYDGNENWPEELEDVSMYPNLFAELVRRGWSDEDLRKVAGENVLRALGQAEKVARRLQQETPPN